MASPVKLQGVGPGRLPGQHLRPGHRPRRRRLRWRHPAGHRLVHQGRRPDLGRQPGRQRRRGRSTSSPRENATTAAGRARQFTSGFQATIDGFDIRGGDQQGFPGNINDLTGAPDRAAAEHHHPGRRDLRQRLRAPPADHQQRGREQRRRLRHHPASARPTCRRRTPTSTTRTSGSPHNRIVANAGTNLAGAHRPLRRLGRLRGRRQRHLRQLLARVRRRRERLRPQPERRRSTTTGSTSTSPTTRAAAS